MRELCPEPRFNECELTLASSPAPDGQKKDCPMDPYQITHERCVFVDHQTIKLQEPPDMVPVGELPRHMLLSADR
jgi:DNA replication licensing factor MCM5